MNHFKNTCPICGAVTQCKCIGPRTETRNPCPRHSEGHAPLRFATPRAVFEIPPRPEVESEVVRAIEVMHTERGEKPRWIVLGWRAWLQLGWDIRKREGQPLRATHYMGIEIVVDEDNPDVIRVLPAHDQVRFGGGL